MFKSILIFFGVIDIAPVEMVKKQTKADIKFRHISELRSDIFQLELPIVQHRCHVEASKMMEILRKNPEYISLKKEIEDREITSLSGSWYAKGS